MKKKSIIASLLSVALAVSITACSGNDGFRGGSPSDPGGDWMLDTSEGFSPIQDYRHESVTENDFMSATASPNSYFSLDRNTASYTMMRKQISDSRKVAENAVRIEEYINYFNYDYEQPTEDKALSISGTLFDCPWNDEHKLMTIGVAAEKVRFGSRKNNIVFLIDTSGSMYGNDRLGLIQQSFTMLTDALDPEDTVSIVTYAGDSRIALDGASGADKTHIANVLQDLQANGSTNGEGGIHMAYDLASKYYSKDANNRVILATDGDFNVGASSKNDLYELISEKRESGINLSVLGVGMHNTNDITMKTLAENGNGNYAYLDSISEARKVLIQELDGTFNVVAKDTKIGVTFNADTVDKYRLIGYETKMLSQEEFDDDKKDAGELGSGHTVTAVYEVVLKADDDGNIATTQIKYKTPDTNENASVEFTLTTTNYTTTPSEDSAFISCVTEYGLLLRNSAYKGNATFESVITKLSDLNCTSTQDGDPFKAEFLELVKKAASIYSE